MPISVFLQTGYRLLKMVPYWLSVLLTFMKVYYYIKQIAVCITRCNTHM